MSITYTQLRSGTWGLRSTSPLTSGATVAVAKRDGTTKSATVGALVWSGSGVYLYAIGCSSGSSTRSHSSHGRSRYGRGRCSECGTHLERWMDGYGAGLCHDCI